MLEPTIALGTFVRAGERPFPGLLVNDRVYRVGLLVAGRIPSGVQDLTMLDILDGWDVCWPIIDGSARELMNNPIDEALHRADVNPLAPIRPRQIVCVGANYRRHVIELMTDHDAGSETGLAAEERQRRAERLMDHRAAHGQPFAFVKPVSALLDPFSDLELPVDSSQPDWELELAVVIGRPAYRVHSDDALAYIAGYTIANDISARDRLARRDMPNLGLDFVSGKSAPGFLPLGPFIVPSSLAGDPQNLMLTLALNGETMQHESTADMIFSVARLIEFVSTHMRLLPGDVVCTGSPAGNGTHYKRFLRPGDIIEGSIEGLGAQRVRCVAEHLGTGAAIHKPFVPLTEPNA